METRRGARPLQDHCNTAVAPAENCTKQLFAVLGSHSTISRSTGTRHPILPQFACSGGHRYPHSTESTPVRRYPPHQFYMGLAFCMWAQVGHGLSLVPLTNFNIWYISLQLPNRRRSLLSVLLDQHSVHHPPSSWVQCRKVEGSR